ncbi:MAG: EamA family transporter [Deltaproteobacteria bacterium]|nr:MAG: EamA family transporter [Deltaproteobacteria bacterium]
MSSLAFTLIIFSALMHALWNLLVKRSQDKTVFIWWMFVASGSLMNLGLPFFGVFPVPSLRVVGLAAIGAVCFMLYHLFNGRAYRSGDLSLTYPLAQTSMFWVPIWGVLILGEKVSGIGVAGIGLILFGAYSIQLRALAWSEVVRPFHNLRDPAVLAALAAGFIYSVGSVIDKTGVMLYSPFHFTYILVAFMLLFMTLNIMRPKYRGRIMAEFRHSRLLVIAAGPVMMGSFFAFRYGLSLAPMSYAVPVRQVSLLIGVLIGVVFLGESCGRIRFAATLFILGGVALIRFG